MSPRVAEIMLGLHTLPPLDACTYVGLDNGAQPLSVSENIQFLKSSVFLFLSPCSSICTTTFLYSSKLYMLTPLLLTLILHSSLVGIFLNSFITLTAVMFISSQLSLFFDILLCLTTEIERDDYVTGAFKSTPGRASPVPGVSDSPQPTLLRARALLWKALRGLKMRAGGWAVHANNHRLSTPLPLPFITLSPFTLPSHLHTLTHT